MLSQVPIRQEPLSQPAGEHGERERKRRRKALSCYDCRRRKLKCDRNFPSCSRCSKAGLASSCRYETGHSDSKYGQEDSVTDEDNENSHIRLPPIIHGDGLTDRLVAGESSSTSSQGRKIAHLEGRIAHLEAALSNQTSGTPSTHNPISPESMGMIDAPRSVENLDSLKRNHKETETTIFRNGSFESQFFGMSHYNAHLVHFPEFFHFAKKSADGGSLKARARGDIDTLKKKRKAERAANIPKFDGNLFTFLPNREEADNLVRLYFDTYETTYRILHRPTFWKEYQDFWLDPKRGSDAFIAILLLAMASVRCISTREPTQYIGESTKERETASLHILVCDHWLRLQGIKHATISLFQIHCLLLLARATNSIKTKETWTFTGSSLRFFMSAGLHRDPNSTRGSTDSEFHKEMRRRLWSTMVEFELEASIMRGMPTILNGLHTDSGCPQNINDDDFDEKSESIPRSRSVKEYTSTTFLCLSQNSLSLRLSMTSAVNSSNIPLPYDDVLLYEKKVMQQLQLIPRWTEETSGANPNSALLEAFLDGQLRQFLIILHYPFARRGSGSSHQQDYSRMACFNAASSIIEQHAKILETGNYALLALRGNDVYRAALCLCQTVYASSLVPSNPINEILNTSSLQSVEKAINMLQQNTLQLGHSYKNCGFASAGYGVALLKTTNRSKESLKQEVIDRFQKVFGKLAAAQCEAFQPVLISEGINKYPPILNGPETQQSNAGTPFFAAGTPFQETSQRANQQFFDFDLFDWNYDEFSSFGVNDV